MLNLSLATTLLIGLFFYLLTFTAIVLVAHRFIAEPKENPIQFSRDRDTVTIELVENIAPRNIFIQGPGEIADASSPAKIAYAGDKVTITGVEAQTTIHLQRRSTNQKHHPVIKRVETIERSVT